MASGAIAVREAATAAAAGGASVPFEGLRPPGMHRQPAERPAFQQGTTARMSCLFTPTQISSGAYDIFSSHFFFLLAGDEHVSLSPLGR